MQDRAVELAKRFKGAAAGSLKQAIAELGIANGEGEYLDDFVDVVQDALYDGVRAKIEGFIQDKLFPLMAKTDPRVVATDESMSEIEYPTHLQSRAKGNLSRWDQVLGRVAKDKASLRVFFSNRHVQAEIERIAEEVLDDYFTGDVSKVLPISYEDHMEGSFDAGVEDWLVTYDDEDDDGYEDDEYEREWPSFPFLRYKGSVEKLSMSGGKLTFVLVIDVRPESVKWVPESEYF
jgi:hypothetical protein